MRSGFFENTCTHPPVPQQSRWKPLACSRCSSSGVSFFSTAVSSSVVLEEERHREDVERLVELGQADGGEERCLQRCRSGRIFLIAVASSPCLPPAIDRQRHAPGRVLVPGVAHVEQRLVPARVGRHERGQLDLAGRGGRSNAGAAPATTTKPFRADIVSVAFNADLFSSAPYLVNMRVDVIEQRPRATLLDERDETDGRILFRVDGQRLSAAAFRTPRGPAPAAATPVASATYGPGRLAFLQLDGAREVLARARRRSAERLGQAVERDEHLVQRPLAPGLVERKRPFGQCADGRHVDRRDRACRRPARSPIPRTPPSNRAAARPSFRPLRAPEQDRSAASARCREIAPPWRAGSSPSRAGRA